VDAEEAAEEGGRKVDVLGKKGLGLHVIDGGRAALTTMVTVTS